MANGGTHIDDQAKTGEDYRAVADEHAQTLKSFWYEAQCGYDLRVHELM